MIRGKRPREVESSGEQLEQRVGGAANEDEQSEESSGGGKEGLTRVNQPAWNWEMGFQGLWVRAGKQIQQTKKQRIKKKKKSHISEIALQASWERWTHFHAEHLQPQRTEERQRGSQLVINLPQLVGPGRRRECQDSFCVWMEERKADEKNLWLTPALQVDLLQAWFVTPTKPARQLPLHEHTNRMECGIIWKCGVYATVSGQNQRQWGGETSLDLASTCLDIKFWVSS